MSEAPAALRGYLYPTHLVERCPNYRSCHRCLQCADFNPHDACCVWCESNKTGQRPCRCHDEQIGAIVKLENMLGRPVLDPNARPTSVTIAETSFDRDNQELADRIGRARDYD